MKVFSIFKSLSGEVGLFPQGQSVVFIRLAGCNLRCNYCDTPKTWEAAEGTKMTVSQILSQIDSLFGPKPKRFLITGGEPLLQRQAMIELTYALKTNYSDALIQVETNGSVTDVQTFPLVDSWVVDYKLPGCGENGNMFGIYHYGDFPTGSWFKFVCSGKGDVHKTASVIASMKDQFPGKGFRYAIGTAKPETLTPAQLAEAILHDPILGDCVLNLQQHKQIWPEGEVADKKVS